MVNSGAQVHHEVKVADFTIINPGVFLLGAGRSVIPARLDPIPLSFLESGSEVG